MSLLDFYAVDETLIQEFTGNDIMVWIGDKASNEKDQVLHNYLKKHQCSVCHRPSNTEVFSAATPSW